MSHPAGRAGPSRPTCHSSDSAGRNTGNGPICRSRKYRLAPGGPAENQDSHKEEKDEYAETRSYFFGK